MVLRGFAKLISVLFHPLLILTYMLVLLLAANPYLFGVNRLQDRMPLILLIFLSTFVIPTIAVSMMKLLGLVRTLALESREERIGPYIITGIFYLWLFVNFLHDPRVPVAFTSFVLGATIGLFLAFFINIFSKISAHAVGMGGLLAMIVITMFLYSYDTLTVYAGWFGQIEISMATVLILAILLAGMVGTSRLLLQAHDMQDLSGGFLVGFVSQFIALQILL